MVDSREDEIEVEPGEVDSSTSSTSESFSEEQSNPAIIKSQLLSVKTQEDKCWRECVVTFSPPHLSISECHKVDPKVFEKQLWHLNQRWYHADTGRREARHLLTDSNDTDNPFLVRGSQTCEGKFAISVRCYMRVLHVMVRSRPHPLTRVEYHVSENGPYFSSLYDLVEECKKASLILIYPSRRVKLGRCVPKFDRSWYDKRLMTHREAEELIKDEDKEGTFLVYQTDPETDSYNITYIAGGRVNHVQILPTVRNRVAGYIFNGIFSPVVYKIIHYFMENPIQAETVLQWPVGNLKAKRPPLCGVAVKHSLPPDLTFPSGVIVNNIQYDEDDPQILYGDYGTVTQRRFKRNCVRLLQTVEEFTHLESENLKKEPTRDPRLRVNNTPTDAEDSDKSSVKPVTVQLDFSNGFRVSKKSRKSKQVIAITEDSEKEPVYEIQCPSKEDYKEWTKFLKPSSEGKKHDCCIL